MADSILKIRTQDGDKPIGYPGLADKPVANKTLDIEGAFADAKVVGDKFKEVKAETDSLKEDIVDLSVGNYIINPNYHSGKIDPSTGEEVAPYDTTRISEKLNFDNYESVIVGTTASKDSDYWLYISAFEFDSSGKYIKQIANTLDKYYHTNKWTFICFAMVVWW